MEEGQRPDANHPTAMNLEKLKREAVDKALHDAAKQKSEVIASFTTPFTPPVINVVRGLLCEIESIEAERQRLRLESPAPTEQ